MVDKEMLSAISDLLEEKLEQKLEKLEEKLEQKLEEKLEQKLEEKLEQKLEEKLEQKLEQKLEEKFEEKLAPINERFDRIEADVEELKQTTSKLTDDMRYVRVVLLENNVIPRLNTIESCYVETSRKYSERAEQIDTMQDDIDILKSTVEKHSDMLQKIS